MPKFEKQYVYFTWDSALEGKTVFFADYISTMKERVENSEIKFYEKVTKGNEHLPFKMASSNANWQFAYYDPYYELKCAHEHGCKLQVLADNKWIDLSNPCWDLGPEMYRVKPEEKQEKQLVTNRELAQWLAEGYGQYIRIPGDIAMYHYAYSIACDDLPVHEDIRVRMWGDTEWHVPTREYMHLEEKE